MLSNYYLIRKYLDKSEQQFSHSYSPWKNIQYHIMMYYELIVKLCTFDDIQMYEVVRESVTVNSLL